MSTRKLVRHIDEVRFVDYVFKGEVIAKQYTDVPFLLWPTGEPCNEANLYINHLLLRNLSTTGGGGSVEQYAYILGRLVRFCFSKRVCIHQMTNSHFEKLIEDLRSAGVKGTKPSQNTVIGNGRVILGFLAHLDKQLGGVGLLGEGGRVKAVKRTSTSSYRGKKIEQEVWDHPALGSPSPVRTRSPIDKDTISALNRAAVSASKTSFLVHRRQILIRVLEMTGARIGEISRLRAPDILEAFRHGSKFLTFYTLKRRKEHKRQVPVMKQDLADLVNFIEISRRSIIRKTSWRSKDHGLLFISERTGSALTTATLSNEIGLLRRRSGVTTRASAHLFRHRFITRMLIHLIEEYSFKNANDLRAALLEIESFKLILTEWTGHATTASLDPYIDLAFAEWRGIKNSVDSVFRRREADRFKDRVDQLVGDLGRNLSPEEFRASYAALRKNLQESPLDETA